ncbi:IclR family transcriptional regulator domain-containing protein [Acidisoma sp. 7E03]
MKQTDVMGGLAKGLRVIEAFEAARPKMAIADIAAVTGLDRATARRCLLTLVSLGYATYDGKYFELTAKVLRLGSAYLSATPLPRLLQPVLDRVSNEVGQSASASVLEGTEIVYIARAAVRRVMSVTLMPGSRLPAWCASMGRVLLAALPEPERLALLAQSDLRPLTPLTKINPTALQLELMQVRAQGFAVINQELEMGLCSIAVPVIDGRGRTVAALNIGASAALVSVIEMQARFLPVLLQAQAELRTLLG